MDPLKPRDSRLSALSVPGRSLCRGVAGDAAEAPERGPRRDTVFGTQRRACGCANMLDVVALGAGRSDDRPTGWDVDGVLGLFAAA